MQVTSAKNPEPARLEEGSRAAPDHGATGALTGLPIGSSGHREGGGMDHRQAASSP
ncbi:hypothetical protein [Oceanibaculum nanhaiense]|uniref:hypothetical protein n=1 Tax=Oceanibaculum nanhaiense TaxID=1909734 RepID=UPI0015942530|nr:hypothetical protein [Oceanibaculum nanhaiense]MBC7135701.1 hypothetical protein [Oceanibaculum nanhaiense]MDM7945557.1 hypothetical protein [Oceanibaculum nanhaiense]